MERRHHPRQGAQVEAARHERCHVPPVFYAAALAFASAATTVTLLKVFSGTF